MVIGVYDDGGFGIDCMVVNNLICPTWNVIKMIPQYYTTRYTKIQSFNKYIASSSEMSRIMPCQTAISSQCIDCKVKNVTYGVQSKKMIGPYLRVACAASMAIVGIKSENGSATCPPHYLRYQTRYPSLATYVE